MTPVVKKTLSGYDQKLPPGSYKDFATESRGFITENFPQNQGNATGGSITDGTIFLSLVGVRPGDVINNIHIVVETAGTGSGCTLAAYALYDQAGNRQATTTDGATPRTATESTGLKTTALSAAYTVPDGCFGLYVAMINKNSTTVPSVLVSGTTDATAAAARTGYFQGCGTGGTSQTSLPATITVATTSAINAWVALS